MNSSNVELNLKITHKKPNETFSGLFQITFSLQINLAEIQATSFEFTAALIHTWEDSCLSQLIKYYVDKTKKQTNMQTLRSNQMMSNSCLILWISSVLGDSDWRQLADLSWAGGTSSCVMMVIVERFRVAMVTDCCRAAGGETVCCWVEILFFRVEGGVGGVREVRGENIVLKIKKSWSRFLMLVDSSWRYLLLLRNIHLAWSTQPLSDYAACLSLHNLLIGTTPHLIQVETVRPPSSHDSWLKEILTHNKLEEIWFSPAESSSSNLEAFYRASW